MNRTSAEVIEHYARTTSSTQPLSARELEASTRVLRWRLGPWLPLAGSSVLDLGCGRGEFLFAMARHGVRDLVGVNLCREEVDLARACAGAEIVCGDAVEYLETTDRTFDLITALNFLEHLDKETLLRCLRGIGRCLKPAGYLVAMVPNAIAPFAGTTRYWDITHEWAFTPNNFRQLSGLAGLDTAVEVRECGPVPHGFVSAARWLAWRVVCTAIQMRLMIEVGEGKGGVYTMDMLVRLRKAAGAGATGTPRSP